MLVPGHRLQNVNSLVASVQVSAAGFDLFNFKVEGAGPRVKLDSSGQTVDSDISDSLSDISEEVADIHLENTLDWEEDAQSFLSDPSGTINSYLADDSDSESCFEEPSTHTLTLDSLTWVATLGVGGFGRVELVTGGIYDIPFALKKMKKMEVGSDILIMFPACQII